MKINSNYKELGKYGLKIQIPRFEINADDYNNYVNIPIKNVTFKDFGIDDHKLYSAVRVLAIDDKKRSYNYFVPVTLNNKMELEFYISFVKVDKIKFLWFAHQDIYFLIEDPSNTITLHNYGDIGVIDIKNGPAAKVKCEVNFKSYIEIEIVKNFDKIFIGAINVVNEAKLPNYNYSGLVKFYKPDKDDIVFLNLIIEENIAVIYNGVADDLMTYDKQNVVIERID